MGDMDEWFQGAYGEFKGGMDILRRKENPNLLAGVIATGGTLSSILIWDDRQRLQRKDYDEAINLMQEAANGTPHNDQRDIWLESINRLEKKAGSYFTTKSDSAAA